MHLLNTLTLQLEEFYGDNVPPYAVLSHQWGEGELHFSNIGTHEAQMRSGYAKMEAFCAKAASAGISYAWMDTCCIDKRSSAALSEAINSMYQWYENSVVCYAHLADVTKSQHSDQVHIQYLRQSRWFTRGWTLQELLAPKHVVFLDQQWSEIGTKSSLASVVSSTTGISLEHLKSSRDASIAQKMSWAAGRQTTRPEDMAYCLLGLFDVNMPLLYGEGQRAFERLQQEIMTRSNDETIFAWASSKMEAQTALLAPSPQAFKNSSKLVCFNFEEERLPYSLTNRGLNLQFPCFPEKRSGGLMDGDALSKGIENFPLRKPDLALTKEKEDYELTDFIMVPLNCRLIRENIEGAVYIIALRLAKYGATYMRTNSSQLIILKAKEIINNKTDLAPQWFCHQVELVDLSEWPSRGVRLKTSEVFQEIAKENSQTWSSIMTAADRHDISGQSSRPITYRKRAIYALSSERQAASPKNKQHQGVLLRHVPRGFSCSLMTEKRMIKQDSEDDKKNDTEPRGDVYVSHDGLLVLDNAKDKHARRRPGQLFMRCPDRPNEECLLVIDDADPERRFAILLKNDGWLIELHLLIPVYMTDDVLLEKSHDHSIKTPSHPSDRRWETLSNGWTVSAALDIGFLGSQCLYFLDVRVDEQGLLPWPNPGPEGFSRSGSIIMGSPSPSEQDDVLQTESGVRAIEGTKEEPREEWLHGLAVQIEPAPAGLAENSRDPEKSPPKKRQRTSD